MARRPTVVLPKTRVVTAIFELLAQNGYLEKVETAAADLKLTLKYKNHLPVLTDLCRVSLPSRRIYVDKNHLPRVLGGRGLSIISTPLGLLTDKEAKIKGVGGEVICKIW